VIDAAGARVLLVGYEDRDNLGLRYLLSSLKAAGAAAGLVRYSSDPAPLVARVLSAPPHVVGLSMIFQYMAPDFRRAIEALRAAGYGGHITVGGHYPSLSPVAVLDGIPGLDSVVRFEGEQTVIELAACCLRGEPWRDLPGIACRDGDEIRLTPLRAPIRDLDALPPPDRASYDDESERVPTAAVLGSRGCPWNSTCCSIRPFHEAQGGALRRFRDPAKVVAEMAALHHERGVSLFLFQDDDFLGGGGKAKQWACDVADQVVAQGLAGRIAWKISCRSDEIDEQTIAHLMAGGLTHIYMGVEAGDPDDLTDMYKRVQPEAHFEAGRILRRLGLSFDFGFMLLQPYSTLQRVRNNLVFLDRFVGDGYAVVGFCRMLPDAGTPIEVRLRTEGRLIGTPFQPDYRFLDPRLDLFYDWMIETFYERNFTERGLNHVFRAALFEARLRTAARPIPRVMCDLLQHLSAWCNQVALGVLTAAVDHLERTPLAELERDRAVLGALTAHEKHEEARILAEVHELFESFLAGPPEVHRPSSDLRPIGSFERTWSSGERATPAV
jgi:anaerobic magnesium-protoporphyrin IX monomethyl ester cyclase